MGRLNTTEFAEIACRDRKHQADFLEIGIIQLIFDIYMWIFGFYYYSKGVFLKNCLCILWILFWVLNVDTFQNVWKECR